MSTFPASEDWVNLSTVLSQHYVEYGIAHAHHGASEPGRGGIADITFGETREARINILIDGSRDAYLYRFKIRPLANWTLSISYARAHITGEGSTNDIDFFSAVLDSEESNYQQLPQVRVMDSHVNEIFLRTQFPKETDFNNFMAFECGRKLSPIAYRLIAIDQAALLYPGLADLVHCDDIGTYDGWGDVRYVQAFTKDHIFQIALAGEAEFFDAWERKYDSELSVTFSCYPTGGHASLNDAVQVADIRGSSATIWQHKETIAQCDAGVINVWSGDDLKLDYEGFLGPVVHAGEDAISTIARILNTLVKRDLSDCRCEAPVERG